MEAFKGVRGGAGMCTEPRSRFKESLGFILELDKEVLLKILEDKTGLNLCKILGDSRWGVRLGDAKVINMGR